MGSYAEACDEKRICDVPVTRFGHHLLSLGVDDFDCLPPLRVVYFGLSGLCAWSEPPVKLIETAILITHLADLM